MVRGLETETIRKFKGINQFEVSSNMPPDWAEDCLNVIPSASGALQKLRSPTVLSAQLSDLNADGNLINFQNALGNRQVIAMAGDHVYRFSLDGYSPTLIDDDSDNDAVAAFTQSNNILFVGNENRMRKWTGSAWQKWGIARPSAPPLPQYSEESGVADPTEALVLTAYDRGSSSWQARTYKMVYIFFDANGKTTNISPPATINLNEGEACVFTLPEIYAEGLPTNAIGWYAYADILGSTNYYGRCRGYWFPGESEAGAPGGDAEAIFFEYGSAMEFGPNYWELVRENWEYYGYMTGYYPTSNETGIGSGQVFTVGRKYSFAFGNSVTGHVGPASEESEITGATPLGPKVDIVCDNPVGDDQIDQIFLFATEDGGTEQYLLPNPATDDGSWPIATGDQTVIRDGTADEDLDHSTLAPLINYPPPVSNILKKLQGRIFVASGQNIHYSAYERLTMGRPEESFPLNNVVRLAIGSDEIKGFGALENGIVAWSRSNEMFTFKGAVEDNSVDEDLQFSAVLDQCPYHEGCSSHLSVQETPYGVIWLGSDKCLKIWDGINPPLTLSGGIYPLLRRITAGQEENCRGIYFKWIEKHWYLLAFPIDTSTILNRILVVDLEPNQEKNVGCFPFSIGNIHGIDIVEDSNGKRQIVFMQDGSLWRLNTDDATTHGIST